MQNFGEHFARAYLIVIGSLFLIGGAIASFEAVGIAGPIYLGITIILFIFAPNN